MSDPLEDLFAPLEPPPAGYSGLLAKIERTQRQRVLARWCTLALGAAAATACVLFLFMKPQRPPISDNPALVRLGILPATDELVEVDPEARGTMAVMRTASPSPDVIIYSIATLDRTPDQGR